MGKLIVGYNDLLTKNPNLAKEWDYSKNTGLLPQDVSVGSKKKVWWKCRICNNVWEATINSRNSGAGLCVWGGINLMEGYGNDNPGANAHVR